MRVRADRWWSGGKSGRLLVLDGLAGVGPGEQRHRVDRQVAALHQPLIVLF
jgi:hypothetical protein